MISDREAIRAYKLVMDYCNQHDVRDRPFVNERKRTLIKLRRERMKKKMSWYAKWYAEDWRGKSTGTSPAMNPKSVILRAVITSATSWEQIAREIRNDYGLAVGDKVDFSLKSGEQVTMVVTDDTDEYVRFESVDCVGGDSVKWNKKCTTDRGIEESNVQEWLIKELFRQLPDDLQQVISKVKRKYKDNEGNLKEYETLLFLPAVSEVFDKSECYEHGGVYEQLEYYRDRRHRMRGMAKGEDTIPYCLASDYGDSLYACYVGYEGTAYCYCASDDLRMPLCFCIKKS